MLVILDNGHGRETPGKRSPQWPSGEILYEWEFNRDVVRRISVQLSEMGIVHKFTCPGDNDIPIGVRCRLANDYYYANGKKAFLVSVHANAAKEPNTGTGWEAFIYNKASKNSEKLGRIFYEFAKDAFIPEWKIREGSGEPFKRANLQILRDSVCPAILTENFFMDNFKDFRYINSWEGRQAVANLHVRAIWRYIEESK